MKTFKKVSTVVLSVLLTSSSIQAFSLGDIANSVVNTVSDSVSDSKKEKDDRYVKDINDSTILSDKPYIRGIAKITFAEINRKDNSQAGEKNNMLLKTSSNRNANAVLMETVKGDFNDVFTRDAKDNDTFIVTDVNTVYSNPKVSDYPNYDLSQIKKFLTYMDESSIYRYKVETHLKVPAGLIEDNHVIIKPESAPLTFNGLGDHVGSIDGDWWSYACFQTINGEFTKGSEYKVKVSDNNTIDATATCYFAGVPESFQFYKLAYVTPDRWTLISPPDPITGESEHEYNLTKLDMFMYKDEIYKKQK